ncbi:MAG: ribonuclease HII [Bacteroidales bacterium]|nr:ribonuclease HII [Lentimicrobiaceae bacterium]MDD5694715.1 ribonuclease HII [Bacteroidales bacterium]
MLISHYTDDLLEAGCDEAGRGCLAGPVYAAAVILPKTFHDEKLNDSKKLSVTLRLRLREEILNKAVAWSVAWATPQEIDQLNILQASFLAMHRAVQSLVPKPEFLLIDGNRFKKYEDIPYVCMVKGDSKYMSIAAASVLAKVFRDEYMHQLHGTYPAYHWDCNKGYPTLSHIKAIRSMGLTPEHRLTFHCKEQLKLTL